MVAPTHAGIGLLTTVLFVRMHGISPGGVGMLMVLVGSIAPDIDGSGSITRPGKILRNFLHWRTARVLDELFLTLNGIIKVLFPHRGFLHWPILGFAIVYVGFALEIMWLFWFGWGYVWHLVADALTMEGVPVLAPFSFEKVRLLHLRTGSLYEGIICVLVWISAAALGFDLLPEETKAALEAAPFRPASLE